MVEQRMNLKRIMPLVLLVLTALVMGCGNMLFQGCLVS